MIASSFANRY